MGKQGEEWVGACQAGLVRKQCARRRKEGEREREREIDEGKREETAQISETGLIVLGWMEVEREEKSLG